MELLEIMQKRRSVRKYTEEPVKDGDLKKILQAGLLAESGKGKRPWEFILVRDKETLHKMAGCREGRVKMLETADCAVVVLGDSLFWDIPRITSWKPPWSWGCRQNTDRPMSWRSFP